MKITHLQNFIRKEKKLIEQINMNWQNENNMLSQYKMLFLKKSKIYIWNSVYIYLED